MTNPSSNAFRLCYDIINSKSDVPDLAFFLQQVVSRVQQIWQHGGATVKMTFFLHLKSEQTFQYARAQMAQLMKDQLSNRIPPVVFIAQPPLSGSLYAVELTIARLTGNGNYIQFKSFNNFNYTVLEEGDARWLFLGLDNYHFSTGDFCSMVHDTFINAGEILSIENMSFRQVIRQWNYIENITVTTQNTAGEFQNYQVFNDSRALFYENSQLYSDFPAATGIGCAIGGFALELIALDSPQMFLPISLKSPAQKNPYEYSKEVLVGDTIHPLLKQAPLFERAKIIIFENRGIVYVSGTAAISGEMSIKIPDAASQTKLTIDNIFELVTELNLRSNQVNRKIKNIQASYVRVYVKNKEQAASVDAVCRKYFSAVPILIVHSDVCREELLVEIEAAFDCEFTSSYL